MPALVTVDHELDVPLDRADPGGGRTTVFAREAADPDGRDRPFPVHLQGGPRFEAPQWPPLDDADVLRADDVPAAAVVRTDDLHVERAFSEETAALVRGMRTWITSEDEHDALRVDGARVLDRLLELVRDRR